MNIQNQVVTEKVIIQKDICTPMFIEALFTIARTWNQPRSPSTDEWIKKLWFIYTMEYYPAIKRNEFESVLVRRINQEPVIQSEVSQKENKYCILTHINGIQKNGTDEPICRSGIEMQTQGTHLWTQQGWHGGRKGGMN